jgi:hypothetical protein
MTYKSSLLAFAVTGVCTATLIVSCGQSPHSADQNAGLSPVQELKPQFKNTAQNVDQVSKRMRDFLGTTSSTDFRLTPESNSELIFAVADGSSLHLTADTDVNAQESALFKAFSDMVSTDSCSGKISHVTELVEQKRRSFREVSDLVSQTLESLNQAGYLISSPDEQYVRHITPSQFQSALGNIVDAGLGADETSLLAMKSTVVASGNHTQFLMAHEDTGTFTAQSIVNYGPDNSISRNVTTTKITSGIFPTLELKSAAQDGDGKVKNSRSLSLTKLSQHTAHFELEVYNGEKTTVFSANFSVSQAGSCILLK